MIINFKPKDEDMSEKSTMKLWAIPYKHKSMMGKGEEATGEIEIFAETKEEASALLVSLAELAVVNELQINQVSNEVEKDVTEYEA